MEGFFNYEKVFLGKVISRTAARVRGILYHQTRKGYPAMISGEGWVRGEFLELKDFTRLLAASDDIENYFGEAGNSEYERRVTPLELLPEEIPVFAHVYWYARSDLVSAENPAEIISSGDWRAYMLHKI
jgi:gamma-glutamylcyclotransferase (GGCT)/AIG2-like uncharacterized protein YtfP